MKTYVSHKVVEAFKVAEIRQLKAEKDEPAAWQLSSAPADDGEFDSAIINQEYFDRCSPQAGGYFVRYADGHTSWSPGATFEAGYTEVVKGAFDVAGDASPGQIAMAMKYSE